MVGVCELIAAMSGGQWLVCVSFVGRPMAGECELCQEANGWRV